MAAHLHSLPPLEAGQAAGCPHASWSGSLTGRDSLGACSRRGRRRPTEAHAVAVGAARRLRCGARPSVASQNSLRSLRSLRSDNCDESVHDARCARRLKASAPRRHTNRLRRSPPAALNRCLFSPQTPATAQRRARTGGAAPLGRREAQGSWPRAKRESSSDSSQLSERSERSERSEFCDGATRPSIAGQSARSADRSSEAQRPVRARLCRFDLCTRSGCSTAAMRREQTAHARVSFMRRGSSEARWSN